MSETLSSIEIPRGFMFRNKNAVVTKLADFTAAGKDNIHIVFDFDGTITTYEHKGRLSTTWQVLSDTLPEEAQKERVPVYEKYRALEIAGKLTPKDAEDWVNESLSRFATYKVSLRDAEKNSFHNFNLRDGAKELFKLC